MGTPASVGVRQRNGTIKSIYVNYDGYPSNMVPVLEALRPVIGKVLAEGDASSLKTTLDGCEFYARDRHEEFEDVAPQSWDDLDAYESGADAPFIYLVDPDNGVELLRDDDAEE